LRKHNVTIEEWNGLQVLTMQTKKPDEGQYSHQWIVDFDDIEGNQEQSWLVVNLEVDPYDTRIEIEYSGDYGCTCKGRGCVKCNEELAATLAGRNPYAHHTTPILAAITTSMDPGRDVSIRVLEPGATGVKNLAARDVQDADEALAIVKATYPAAKIVAPRELDEEVLRRQPRAEQTPVVEIDDLADIEF